jgi:excisionase family DNA binding protein
MASRSKQQPVPALPTPRLLGVAAAAAYLGATPWAIRKLQWERTIPSIRIGQRVLFDIADLNTFIEKQKLAAR